MKAKPGWQTTEFWVTIGGLAAVAFPQIAPIVGIATTVAQNAGDLSGPAGVIGGIVASYNVGRSYYKAKTGRDLPGIEVQGRQ
jgi:hypothetical protein